MNRISLFARFAVVGAVAFWPLVAGSQPTGQPLYHIAIYPHSGITLRTEASCVRFWWQPSTLTLGAVTEIGRAYDLGKYRRYACRGWAA